MTKKRLSALEALGAFEEEQRVRDKKADELRHAAALELGQVVFEAGGAALPVLAIRTLIQDAVRTATSAGSLRQSRRS